MCWGIGKGKNHCFVQPVSWNLVWFGSQSMHCLLKPLLTSVGELFLLMHWSRNSSFCVPARESWNILGELRLEGISGNHPFQPSCSEQAAQSWLQLSLEISKDKDCPDASVWSTKQQNHLYIFVLSRICQISTCALCLLLVIPLSTDSGIVLGVTELGISSGGNWETSWGISAPAAWYNLTVGLGGFGLSFCGCSELISLQCLILTRVAFFAHIHGQSWDLRAANSSTSVGPWFSKEHPLEEQLRSCWEGNQQQQGLLCCVMQQSSAAWQCLCCVSSKHCLSNDADPFSGFSGVCIALPSCSTSFPV